MFKREIVSAMKYKFLNNCKDMVSILGFGCMRLPNISVNDNKINKEIARKLLLYAYKHGINYYDTGYFYNDGTNEKLLGEVFKSQRSQVYIATKLPMWSIKTKEDIEKIFNEQLTRLKSGYIDYYLLHAVDDHNEKLINQLAIYDFLINKKKQGYIRHIGFSYHGTGRHFKSLINNYNWEFTQLQYNFLENNLDHQDERINYAKQKNIDIFIMGPLKGGLLVKRVLEEKQNNMVKNINQKLNLAELAFKWIYSNKNIDMVLSGMGQEDILIANIEMMQKDLTISESELQYLDFVKNKLKKLIKVMCTQCGYCLPCPYNIRINENIRIYNDYFVNLNSKDLLLNYFALKEGIAAKCKKCNFCLSKCPQKIDIPNVLGQLLILVNEKKKDLIRRKDYFQ